MQHRRFRANARMHARSVSHHRVRATPRDESRGRMQHVDAVRRRVARRVATASRAPVAEDAAAPRTRIASPIGDRHRRC
jgi:hypothetical protein